MNYENMSLLEISIGAIACCLGLFLVGSIISYRKFKEIKIYHTFLFFLASILIVVNTIVFDNVVKIFGTLIVLFILFKTIYKETIVNSFMTSIITYIIFTFGEITFVLIVSLIDMLLNSTYMMDFVRTSFANFGISVFSCLYAFLLRGYINKTVSKLNKNNIVYIFTLGIVIMFVILSSIYNLYLNKWIINYKFILNIIIIIGSIVLIAALLKQYLKNKEIVDKYQLLEDYLKTSAGLVEKYSSTIHKYKNNLIAIKGYIKTNTKYANQYIDKLLDDFKTKKYGWFSKINYINFDSIRYLIYYKLSKAEENNLKIIVTVSEDINVLGNEDLNLNKSSIVLELIGEFFDNAIYASNESKQKELNFNMYLDDKKIIFEIANTYREKINLDLITKNGYTTKGEGHGLGLYNADKVIKANSFLEHEIELYDDYFIVRLKVKAENKIFSQKMHE